VREGEEEGEKKEIGRGGRYGCNYQSKHKATCKDHGDLSPIDCTIVGGNFNICMHSTIDASMGLQELYPVRQQVM